MNALEPLGENHILVLNTLETVKYFKNLIDYLLKFKTVEKMENQILYLDSKTCETCVCVIL